MSGILRVDADFGRYHAISPDVRGRAHVFPLDLDDHLQLPKSAMNEMTLDVGTARWALDHDEQAASAPNLAPRSLALCIPSGTTEESHVLAKRN